MQGGNPVKSPLDELYELPGRIFGGGTGPTLALLKGATMVRGGTGKYTILPDVNYPFVAAGPATIMTQTNFGYQVAVSGYYNGATTGFAGHTAGATAFVTYQVTAGGIGSTGGAAVDLAAGEELWFHLAFVRSVRP